jgi:asparagine synthetase B (glutamine-hydrolysing)
MCKVLIAVGIKNTENAWKFAKEITPKLSDRNDDGFGYAAIDANGKIFGEKWLKNKDAYKEYGLSEADKLLLTNLGVVSVKESLADDYNKFGDVRPNEMVALMLHARAATGEVNIKNTHPFMTKGTALIHNGVIYNHDKLTKTMSTCDSEVILNEYLDFNVAQNAEQIGGVVENLRGHFACGVLTKGPNGPIVDVFKSVKTFLYTTYINEMGCFVFCTSKLDLENSIRYLQWQQNKIFELAPDQFFRFDAITGEKIEHFKVDSIETYNPNYVTPYNNDDKERDQFTNVVDKFQKEVNWVEMIEKEESDRLAAKVN